MKKFITLFALIALMPFAVFAQESAPVEYGSLSDFVSALLAFASSYKSLGSLAVASGIVSLVMQGLKTEFIGKFIDLKAPKAKLIALVVLGQVAPIINAILSGQNVLDAIVSGLFVSGGAMVIYETIKHLKQEPQA